MTATSVTAAGRLGPVAAIFAVFAALYAAFGAASPLLPAFMASRGISPGEIGVIFAAGTAIRLVSAPIAGRIADGVLGLRLTLAICAVGTSLAVLCYLPVSGYAGMLAVSILHALWLAPAASLADALALTASWQGGDKRLDYGWFRGTGSAAFVAGLLIAGAAIPVYGQSSILWLEAGLVALVPLALAFAPSTGRSHSKPGSELCAASVTPKSAAAEVPHEGIVALLRRPDFRRLVLVGALVLGSHAMHDTFSVIRWSDAGITPRTVSILWSLSVSAEVLMFVVAGPWILHRVSPGNALRIAAAVAAGRWLVSAETVNTVVLALIQPLHGTTFALLHMAAMRILADTVPPRLAATAQALYGTVGIGIANVLVTLASGWLVARMGYQAFLVMAALCLAALPFTSGLDRRSATGEPARSRSRPT